MNAMSTLRGWRPLHTWTRRRRALVAATLAMLAALLSGIACFLTDAGGAQAARSALAQGEARLADARRTLARLPALRREAEGWPRDARLTGSAESEQANTSADDIRSVSRLAADAGLVLIALEPAAPGGAKAQAFRATKLAARGGFAQLRAFLAGLAEWPELAVPADIVVRRNGSALAIAATLHVFGGLPAVAIEAADVAEVAAIEERTDAARDPFASRFALAAGGGAASGVQGDGALRLVGTLSERGRVLALIETADGTLAVQPGAPLAGGRVTGVGPERVVLSVEGATQVLNWAEAHR
ncbi:hypothetical protein [Paraburkholderia tropica]|uniref:Uncharacterized protein n=1 Tax=Paraburkholderia tropica TaxID=92647 RepID=A0AAQ1GMT7_9BURK|nr:hypothetical protein [Paraburkholderia tropica]RQN35733.1 hypothetical protein EHZ25_28065 [Paraburkholderia tropica]SEK13558.1 hypothetical protein SAMN05216550_12494 [Paraburkholderia tropica]